MQENKSEKKIRAIKVGLEKTLGEGSSALVLKTLKLAYDMN